MENSQLATQTNPQTENQDIESSNQAHTTVHDRATSVLTEIADMIGIDLKTIKEFAGMASMFPIGPLKHLANIKWDMINPETIRMVDEATVLKIMSLIKAKLEWIEHGEDANQAERTSDHHRIDG